MLLLIYFIIEIDFSNMKEYLVRFQEMLKNVTMNSDKHTDIVDKCNNLGIDHKSFTANFSEEITWDDGERLISKIGIPTIYAASMCDTHAKSVNESTTFGLLSFNTTKDHVSFAVPACYVIVGMNADKSPITMFSDAHLLIILNSYWNEWMIQNNKNINIPTDDEKRVKAKWFKALREQRGEGLNNMANTTMVIIYLKTFFVIENSNDIHMYFKTKTYGDDLTFKVISLDNMFNYTILDKNREKNLNVGFTDYEKRNSRAFKFTKTDVTYEDSVKNMKDKVADKHPKDVIDIDIEKEDIKKEDINYVLPFITQTPIKFNLSCVTITSTPIKNHKKDQFKTKAATRSINMTRGGLKRSCNEDEDETSPEAPEELKKLEVYTTKVNVSEHIIGQLTPLDTKITSENTPMLRPVSQMTVNLMLNVNPKEDINTITEESVSKIMNDYLETINVLQEDLNNIPNSKKFASMTNQTAAHFKGGSETEFLVKNIIDHDKMIPNPLSGKSINEEIEALLAMDDSSSCEKMMQDIIDTKTGNISTEANNSLTTFVHNSFDSLVVKVTSREYSNDKNNNILVSDKNSTKYNQIFKINNNHNLYVDITNIGTWKIDITAKYFSNYEKEHCEEHLCLNDGDNHTMIPLKLGKFETICGWNFFDTIDCDKKIATINFVKS